MTGICVVRGSRFTSAVAAIRLPAAAFAAVVGLYWAAVVALNIPPYLAPAPPDMIAALQRAPGYLLRQTGMTVLETIAGYGIAVAVGVAAAVALTSARIVERALYPLLLVVNAVPKVVVAPVLVVWLGFGTAPKVFMVALICFFPVALATATGLLSTPVELAEMARSMTAGRWHFLTKIQLRCALPHAFVGLKAAMSFATVGAIVGEFAGGSQGIGFVIAQASGYGDVALTGAGAVLISAASIILYYLVVLLERLAVPWTWVATLAR